MFYGNLHASVACGLQACDGSQEELVSEDELEEGELLEEEEEYFAPEGGEPAVPVAAAAFPAPQVGRCTTETT